MSPKQFPSVSRSGKLYTTREKAGACYLLRKLGPSPFGSKREVERIKACSPKNEGRGGTCPHGTTLACQGVLLYASGSEA